MMTCCCFCVFFKGGGSCSDERATVSGPLPPPSEPAQISTWCRLPEEDRVSSLSHTCPVHGVYPGHLDLEVTFVVSALGLV